MDQAEKMNGPTLAQPMAPHFFQVSSPEKTSLDKVGDESLVVPDIVHQQQQVTQEEKGASSEEGVQVQPKNTGSVTSSGTQTHKQVAQEVLQKELECPVCYKYMVSVIEECNNGHCICSSCRKNISQCPQCKTAFSGHRNRLAESIADKVMFPCQNAEFGCSDTCLGSQLLDHHRSCPWREYDCLMPACKWTGRATKILDHFKIEHNANILNRTECTIVWRNVDFKKSNKMCYLIQTEQGLFFYTQEVIPSKQLFACCIQFIGPADRAADFQYKVELPTNEQGRRAVLVDSVTDDTQTAEVLFEKGEGLQMAILFIKTFVDGDSVLTQKLEITGKK